MRTLIWSIHIPETKYLESSDSDYLYYLSVWGITPAGLPTMGEYQLFLSQIFSGRPRREKHHLLYKMKRHTSDQLVFLKGALFGSLTLIRSHKNV